MVRLAAKRGGARFFVANLAHIPVEDQNFDFATLLFAPFQEAELVRILKPSGRLFLVVPGKRHLFGLKQAVYDSPYENDEALPETKRLPPSKRLMVSRQWLVRKWFFWTTKERRA